MIIPFTILLGTVGYLYYKSKEDISLVDGVKLDSQKDRIDEDDLYRDLEDLFI